MAQYSDPGIPTLTQRAEPSFGCIQPNGMQPTPRLDDEVPVLTDIAAPAGPVLGPDMVGKVNFSPSALSTTAASAESTLAVLKAALQTELEQALNQAVDVAVAHLRSRLEAQLPALIERAVSKVRPG